MTARTGAKPQPFNSDRYAYPTLGEIEAEWTGTDRFSNIERHNANTPKLETQLFATMFCFLDLFTIARVELTVNFCK